MNGGIPGGVPHHGKGPIMKTTGRMKTLRVYFWYYLGKMLGQNVRIFGRPGSARFKCVRFSWKGPKP